MKAGEQRIDEVTTTNPGLLPMPQVSSFPRVILPLAVALSLHYGQRMGIVVHQWQAQEVAHRVQLAVARAGIDTQGMCRTISAKEVYIRRGRHVCRGD
jgi:hypothetical protein